MKSMKQNILIATLLGILAGCGEGKEAREKLENARTLYEQKQFIAAKSAIDSIHTAYPREVAVRRDALALMRAVERGECMQNIAFCDSVLPIRQSELDDRKKGFVFEKDPAYDEIGNYVWQTMTIERNIERSYIRCGVNEHGRMYVASVYFGSRPLGHTGLKLSTGDGAFAQTPAIPYDGGRNYRFTDLGNTTEVVTYEGESCKAIVGFIDFADKKARIKAEYTGGKPFALYLSDADRKAIQTTGDLAQILSDINAMQKEISRSRRKIERIDGKQNPQPEDPEESDKTE
jgi:hypothetical protein